MPVKAVTICVVWALFLLSPLPGASQDYRAKQYGDLLIQAEGPPSGSIQHGYSEYRISVSNNSGRPHQVSFAIPDGSLSSSLIESVTRSTVVEAGSSVTVSLFVPALPLSGGPGVRVTIDGDVQQEGLPVNFPQPAPGTPSVLLGRNVLTQSFQKRAESVLKTPDGRLEFLPAVTESPPARWSSNWLGYSRYDGIVLTAGELRSMPSATVSAVLSYLECGGVLVVIGRWEVPQAWQSRQNPASLVQTYQVGFGQCKLISEAEASGLTPDKLLEIQTAWNDSLEPWQTGRIRDPKGANSAFPVVDSLSIPIRGLLLMMLLFVMIIGPVNLVVLSRKRKKLWLLWTVPAISLATCVAVSAYSILSEGLSASSRTEVVTVLDEESHRAATIGIVAFYAALTPGGGLHFSTDTELTPQLGAYYYYRSGSSGPPRTIDWTQDQHLVSGWVTARIPSHFMVRRSEMRRERLAVQRAADGSLTVTNGLGASVKELWLFDHNRRFFHAGDIPAGASVRLSSAPAPAPAATSPAPLDLRRMFISEWSSLNNALMSNASSMLTPGSYLASLDGAPFIEEGLPGAAKKRSSSVVYGIMKGSE